jgi:hypothetical protein
MEEQGRNVEIADDDAVDSERRAALGRMGKIAHAPAVVTLLTANAGAAWAGSHPVRGKPSKGRKGRRRGSRRHG